MESFSDDEKFEIDQILGQRKRKGILEYLVRWKGTDESGDSWEPAKSITVDCIQAVKAFLESQKSQKASRSKSRSASRSRSRSSSRSRRAAATKAGKSSRSRSRGRQEKQKATADSKQTEEKDETKVRRSLRQKAAAESPKQEEEVEKKSSETEVATASSSVKVTQVMSNTNSVEESDTPRRTLRSTTMEQRDKLEVQRVHNEQRPVHEDDSKPRSPIWKVADYIVIVLFVISLIAAVFLFFEKFVDLKDFKKQAFPNFGVLKGRLYGAGQSIMDVCYSVVDHISDGWLYLVELVKKPETVVANEKVVPK